MESARTNCVPRFFTFIYCKLLCNYFIQLLKRKQFWQILKFMWNTWRELKLMIKLYLFSELWNSFSRVYLRNCFWCYFRQLFIFSASKKSKRDCKLPKIVQVQDFCPIAFSFNKSTVKYLKLFKYKVFAHWRLQLVDFQFHFVLILFWQRAVCKILSKLNNYETRTLQSFTIRSCDLIIKLCI